MVFYTHHSELELRARKLVRPPSVLMTVKSPVAPGPWPLETAASFLQNEELRQSIPHSVIYTWHLSKSNL
jgi:hypothetical protein